MREPWPSEHAGKRSIGTPASAGMLIGFTLRACPPRPDERRDHLSPWQASISETCAPCPQYKLAPTRPGRNQPFVRPLRSLLSSPIEVELNLNFLSFFLRSSGYVAVASPPPSSRPMYSHHVLARRSPPLIGAASCKILLGGLLDV